MFFFLKKQRIFSKRGGGAAGPREVCAAVGGFRQTALQDLRQSRQASNLFQGALRVLDVKKKKKKAIDLIFTAHFYRFGIHFFFRINNTKTQVFALPVSVPERAAAAPPLLCVDTGWSPC